MGIKIIVCVKSVVTNAPDGRVVRSSNSCELNPYDRPPLDIALRLREELGGTITALSMGPEPCAFTLNEAMAMGADSGILLCDPAFAGSDTLATSSALAGAIKKLAPFDLVLFGDRSSDSDTGQVGPQTSVHLNLPLVTNAHSLEPKEDYLLVERKVDGFLESYKVFFPAALTIHPGAVQPRDVGLFDIKTAYNDKDVKYWDLSDLGLSSDSVGQAGSATSLLTFSCMESARKCEFLSGLAEEQADQIVSRLSELGMV